MKYHLGLRVGSLECHHYLRQHPRLVSRIAWREVKRLDAAHIGLPRNFSGSRGCKMGPLPRQCGVRPRNVRRVEPFHFSPRYAGEQERMLAEVMTAFQGSHA